MPPVSCAPTPTRGYTILLLHATKQKDISFSEQYTWNAGTTAQKIFGTQNNDFALFGAYLRTALPANTVVESWEWELDLIAPEHFHHPPTHITNQVTLGILGQRSTHVLYEPAAIQSAYLIDGPFSNWTEIYRAVITARGHKVGAVGPYTLYRLEQFTAK